MKTQELEFSSESQFPSLKMMSLEQNIKSSCKKIQKVCKMKTALSCARALENCQVSEEWNLLETPISKGESKR